MNTLHNTSSPFYPGQPLPIALLTGREDVLRHTNGLLDDLQQGRTKAMCLYGDRGSGKTSLAGKVCQMARKRKDVLVLQVYIGGCQTPEDLICSLVEAYLLSCVQEKGVCGDTMLWVERYLNQEIPGVPLRHNLLMQDADVLWQNLNTLVAIMAKHSKRQQILICMDDVPDALLDYAIPHLLNVLLANSIGSMYTELAIGVMLCTQKGAYDILNRRISNLAMAINWVEVKPLSMQDAISYVNKTTQGAGMKLQSNQLDLIYHYSKGNPLLLQLLADGVYRQCDSNEPSQEAFLRALASTAILARKRLTDPVLRKILCITDYHSLHFESRQMAVAI